MGPRGTATTPLSLPLTTERLEIRRYRPQDIAAIHTVLYGDDEARRLTGGASTLQTQAVIEGYMKLQDSRGYSFWAVVERTSGELIGEAGLKPFEGGGTDAEIGYAFGAPWWKRGYQPRLAGQSSRPHSGRSSLNVSSA